MQSLVGEKKHRVKKSGAKADKKASHQKKKRGLSNARSNPRAFSVANVVRTKKAQQRNLDKAQQKEVVPLTNRLPDIPPPVFVVVMGPKQCGKSTLIRSLVKLYSSQNLTSTTGPITCIAGRQRRVTFYECPDDIHAMTDLAKVADLVLLMIDASYGFEIDTFEFLNQLQLHGFPKVIGVLTHLDKFKVNKSLQKAKKALKHRFWTEIYDGAKMFELSGVVNGKYPKHEVKRLSLHISRVKFRPLVWRNTHPYMVVDRVEDVTPQQKISADPNCDRDLSLFGYVRGTNMKVAQRVHLIGGGDFTVSAVSALDDPCPMPGQREKTSLKKKDALLYAPFANVGRLKMDGDGLYIELKNVNYTKPENLLLGDALETHPFGRADEVAGPSALLKGMQDVNVAIDSRLEDAEMSLFGGGKAVKSSQAQGVIHGDSQTSVVDEYDLDWEDAEDDDDENEDDDNDASDDDTDASDDDSSEGGCDDDVENSNTISTGNNRHISSSSWKDGMKAKAVKSYSDRASLSIGGSAKKFNRHRATNSVELTLYVYGAGAGSGSVVRESNDEDDDAADDSGDELFTPIGNLSLDRYKDANTTDSSRIVRKPMSQKDKEGYSTGVSVAPSRDGASATANQSKLRLRSLLKVRFVTGGADAWSNPSSAALDGGGGSAAGSADGSDEAFGDFEDLEEKKNEEKRDDREDWEDSVDGDSGSNPDSEADGDDDNDEIDRQLREAYAKKKTDAKSKFDSEYDTKKEGAPGASNEDDEEENDQYLETQRKIQEEVRERNKTEFGEEGEAVRQLHEGFRSGLYVRILLKAVPVEFVRGFRPDLPVIVGGLAAGETAMGFVRARVKRHRWHKRILKSNDPLIFSVGWRRFQSIPVYTIEDDNERQRFLKYTPEHMHCSCIFYGPIVPPTSGVLAFQNPSRQTPGFRISITGTVLEAQSTSSVVKKLKLVGTPVKIFRNTAFITGMFNSALEVAKFEGSKLKTVSGIRGQIKKAVRDGEPGTFRASFEDKILMSDIITCRLWVPVVIPSLYNPVLSLLTGGDKNGAAEERSGNSSSLTLMRTTGQLRRDQSIPIDVNKDSLYKPIVRVPREFRKLKIPGKLQEQLPFKSKPKLVGSKKAGNYVARRAIIAEPEDKKKRAAVQILSTISADKLSKRRQSHVKRAAAKHAKSEREKNKFEDISREERKRAYRDLGKERSAKKQRNG